MKNKGQVTLESSMVIIILVAALLAMFGYFRTSIQGNWKTNSDTFSPGQYEKGKSSSMDSGITFSNARIRADIGRDNVVDDTIGGLNTAPSSGYDIKQINGWGRYR